MKIHLVTNSTPRAEQSRRLLTTAGYRIVAESRLQDDLRARHLETPADLLLLSFPDFSPLLADGLRQLTERLRLPVVILVDEADPAVAVDATRAGACAFVAGPVQPERIQTIIAAAVARFAERQKLEHSLADARQRLAERKLIERAKGLLMTQRGCSENEAYVALRRLAMQRNRRLAEIAASVIDAAELMTN